MNFSEGVSRNQLLLVGLNLRLKIFWNLFIYRELWNLNCSGEGFLGINSFGHCKFEVKIFLEFFRLQSTVDSELFRGGGCGHQFFLVMLN